MLAKVLATCALAVCSIDVAAVEPQYGAANAGATTACLDFIDMDTAQQTELVKQLAGSSDAGVSNTDKDSSDGADAVPAGGDYSLNSVVAACRNQPDLTVGEAIAKGSGGTSQGSSGTSGKSQQ
jgi:hypothetical protein